MAAWDGPRHRRQERLLAAGAVVVLVAMGALWPSVRAGAVESVGEALPEDAALNLHAEHPNGTQVHVTAITFADDRITVSITVDNGSERDIDLAGLGAAFGSRPLTLHDDLGNPYVWSPPAGQDGIPVPTGTAADVELVFLGRVDRGAGELTLTLNDSDQDLVRSPHSRAPRFDFTIPLTWDEAARVEADQGATEGRTRADDRLPYEQRLSLQVLHEPTRTILSVRAVAFTLDTITLDVRVANRHSHDRDVSLQSSNGRTVLDDDLGNRYLLLPPPDNPRLATAPAQVVTGRLTFVGGIHPGASELTLRTNWMEDGPRPGPRSDPFPSLELAGIPVRW